MLNIKEFELIVLLTNSKSSKSDLGKTMKQCVKLEETAWLNQICSDLGILGSDCVFHQSNV